MILIKLNQNTNNIKGIKMKIICYSIFVAIVLYVGFNFCDTAQNAMQKNLDRSNYALSIK